MNAGHWEISDKGREDTGHVTVNGIEENDLVIEIRDEIKKLRPDWFYVPDHLNLRHSIDWVNERAFSDSIGLDLHLNAHNNTGVQGTEVFHYNDEEVAAVVSEEVSKALMTMNRGAKPDTATWVGQLGWCRQLRCPSVVVEFAFMTNPENLSRIMSREGKKAAAEGIVGAVERIQGGDKKRVALLKKLIKLYKTLLQALLAKKQ